MTSVPYHIESTQLICNANQLTGFCMYVLVNTEIIQKTTPSTTQKEAATPWM